jgi:hypothetical protein
VHAPNFIATKIFKLTKQISGVDDKIEVESLGAFEKLRPGFPHCNKS